MPETRFFSTSKRRNHFNRFDLCLGLGFCLHPYFEVKFKLLIEAINCKSYKLVYFFNSHSVRHCVAKDNGFRDVLHWLTSLLALALQHFVSLWLVNLEFSLQDALGSLDKLSHLKLVHQLQFFFLQAGHLDLRADKEPYGRNQCNFAFTIDMGRSILQVEHTDDASATQQRY